jgi:hypothetical protein
MLSNALTVTPVGITTKEGKATGIWAAKVKGQKKARRSVYPAGTIHHVRGDARETSYVVARPTRNASRIDYPQVHKSAASPQGVDSRFAVPDLRRLLEPDARRSACPVRVAQSTAYAQSW